ncbi:MAG: hypothetical protein HFG77_16350 [Hungatella sp.]|jgi:hypothetical protein|nr:hypothetical protein [Hungatella sp.]
MFNLLKKTLVMMMMCLCLSTAAVPAMEAQAVAQIQPAAQTAVQDSQTTQAEDEESAFFLLFMGGGLLIILFAVISAMSTVSGAISIAVNMDVDGE